MVDEQMVLLGRWYQVDIINLRAGKLIWRMTKVLHPFFH